MGALSDCCPICNQVGNNDDLIKDQRWENLVHNACVFGLSRWPAYAKRGDGKYGTDDFI